MLTKLRELKFDDEHTAMYLGVTSVHTSFNYCSKKSLPSSIPSTMLNLDTAFHEAVIKGKFSDGPIYLGKLEDFDSEKVRTSPRKFVVRNQALWITHTNSIVQAEACSELGQVLENGMRNQCNPKFADKLKGSTNSDFGNIPSLYGCTAKQGKNFDAYLRAQLPDNKRFHPLIACEISFRHESFPVLVEEGLSAISRFTDVAFCLLVDLMESKKVGEIKKVNHIRILLLERVEEFASDTGLLGAATKRNCRKNLPEDLQDLIQKDHPESKILFDQTFSREEISCQDFDCIIQFPTATVRRHLKSSEWFTKQTVDVSLKKFMFEVIANVDHLESIGQYPSFWTTSK